MKKSLKQYGQTNASRSTGSLLAGAIIGGVALSDRLSFGDGGAALAQTSLPELQRHVAAAAGEYTFVANRLSAAAQQLVDSLDFTTDQSRFAADAQALGVLGYVFSYEPDTSPSATFIYSGRGTGSAVPPELRGFLSTDESNIFQPSDSGAVRPFVQSPAAARSGADPAQPDGSQTRNDRESPDGAGDSPQERAMQQAETGADSALDFFDGLDVSLDPAFAQTLARLQINTASETQLADAMSPLMASPLALAGAGGGGGAASGITGGTASGGFSGRVFDGYIAYMDVFIDLDGDLEWDEGELITVTGADGSYSFSEAAPAGSMIVALGNDNTIDISTGASVDMLVASADSQYISPLSSAYAYAETDAQRSALLDSLGLTTLNYDPIAVLAAGGDTSSEAYTAAATMVVSGAALLSLATNAASLVTGITGTDTSNATRSIFSALAKTDQTTLTDILTGEGDSDGDEASIGLLITDSMDDVMGVTGYLATVDDTDGNLTAMLSSSASAIRGLTAAMNQVDMTASGALDDVFATASVAQSNLKSSMADVVTLVASGDYAGAKAGALAAKTAYTGTALTALKVEAKQFAELNADDGSDIVAKADVFRLNVGGEVQTFSPLANDLNRTDSELNLVYVGVRDISATVGVAEVTGVNTLTVSAETALDNWAVRLNDADVLADLELYTLDGARYVIKGYTEADGVGTLTIDGDISEAIGESVGFAVAKKLPTGLTLTIEDGQSLGMSYVWLGSNQSFAVSAGSDSSQGVSVTLTEADGTVVSLSISEIDIGTSGAQATEDIAALESMVAKFQAAPNYSSSGYTITSVGGELNFARDDGEAFTTNFSAGSNDFDGRLTIGDIDQISGDITTSVDEASSLRAVDLFYVVGAQADPTQLDAGVIKVYVQPPAPTISIDPDLAQQLQNSGGKFVVSETTLQDEGAATEVLFPLLMDDKTSLGMNGFLRIEADYADWSDKQWLLGTGNDIATYSAAQVKSDLYEDGFAAVWIVSWEDVLASDLSTLRLHIPDDWSGGLSPFTVSATAVYGAQENTSFVTLVDGTTDFQVEVTAVADGLDVNGSFGIDTLLTEAVEDVASTFFDSANVNAALETEISKLTLRDADSEGIALTLALPEADSKAVFLQSASANSATFMSALSDDGLSVSFYAHGAEAVESLAQALASQTLLGNTNESGAVQVDFKVGSYEISSLTTAGPSELSWVGTSGVLGLTITAVSDVPNAPIASLQSDFSDAVWVQGDYAGVGVFKVPVYYQLAATDVSEVVSLAINAFAVDEVGAVIYQDGVVVTLDETLDAYVLAAPAGGQGFFEIEVLEELSSWVNLSLNLSLTARSLDATLSDVSSNYAEKAAVPLQIQFEETPKEPAVQFLPSALLSFNEDVAIPLTDVLTITPAGGRALKDVTVKLEFPTNNIELKVYRDGVDVTGQEIKLSTIADATGEVDLSRLTLQGVTHAKGTIDGITLTAFDTVSETGVSSTSVIATSGVLSVLPIADGVDSAALSASLSAGLVVGLGLSVELSDGNGGGFLGGLAKIDTSETLSIRLGFTGVTSADMAVKVGDRFLGATSATVDGNAGLYFSISEADLNGGEGISLVARNGFSSVQGGYVQAYTNDGGVLAEPPIIVNFGVTIGAIAPLTQANDIVGTESDAEGTGIAVPISIALNANRADFEKIGLIVTTSDSALEAGVFTVNDIDGNVLDDITFDTDSESWELFKDLTTQLDFDTVKFKAPSNYSGDSTFTVTPFAKTGTDTGTDTVEATPLELGMQIVASAEALALSTGTPSPLVLTEQGASFAHDDDSSTKLDLLGLLDTSALAAVGVDIDERLIFNVTVPDTLFVYAYTETGGVQRLAYNEGATGNTYSLNRLLSDSSASEGLGFDQYYLSSTPYHAVSGSDQLTVEIQTSEPSSGDSYTVGTVNIGYQVEAVANGTPAITLLKPTALISESSPANANAVKLSTVIDLASDVSYDDSETLSIFITADQREHLNLYERVDDIDTDITSDINLAIAGVDKTGWLVDASKLPNLYVRGDDYFSSATPVSIQLRAVSAEKYLPDLAPEISDAVDFSLTVKPVADGVTDFTVVEKELSLDEYMPTGTRSGYEVGLDKLISGATMLDADGSESIFYKVTLPQGELAFVNSASGTATMPKASVSGDGKISYDVAEGQLTQYAVRGTLYNSSDDDGSNGLAKGSFSIDVAAFTKESNGLTSSLSASETITLTLDPVAGQVFSSVPTTVAGLDKGAGIALPIRAYTLDASETLSVSIAFSSPNADDALGQNDLSFFIGETKVESGNGGFTVDFDDATKTTTLSVSAEAISSLKDLRVSSTKDFRGDGELNVSTVFTVTDGVVERSDPAVISTLSIFQEVPQVEFKFSEYQYGTGQGDGAVQYELRGEAEAEIKFSLDKPLDMPDGIGLDAVTILVSNVPSDAYFVVGSTPVGAAIGETGLWVFSASDLFAGNTWAQGPPESGGLKMVGLLVNVPSSGAIMSASAFVVDALGGTSASQPVASEMLGGINLASENMSDPLVFSWTGEDVAAIRLDTSDPTGADPDDRIYIDFDKDGKSDLASAWLTQPDAEKYSFFG